MELTITASIASLFDGTQPRTFKAQRMNSMTFQTAILKMCKIQTWFLKWQYIAQAPISHRWSWHTQCTCIWSHPPFWYLVIMVIMGKTSCREAEETCSECQFAFHSGPPPALPVQPGRVLGCVSLLCWMLCRGQPQRAVQCGRGSRRNGSLWVALALVKRGAGTHTHTHTHTGRDVRSKQSQHALLRRTSEQSIF